MRAAQASMNPFITAATNSSPRRCGSWNSAVFRCGRPGSMVALCRRAPPRTPSSSCPICSARPNRALLRRAAAVTSALLISGSRAAGTWSTEQQMLDHLGLREDRQQRDDIGEALVEGGLIRVGRIHVALAQRVEQRVRRLVHDDVVRQARVDRCRPTSRRNSRRPVPPRSGL